jgi:hypothetical protein
VNEWTEELGARLRDAWESSVPLNAPGAGHDDPQPSEKSQESRAQPSLHRAQNADDATGPRLEADKQQNILLLARLVADLTDTDANRQRQAATALGDTGDRRVVEPLITALHSAHRRVAQAAARSLGKLRDPRAVTSLIEALDDPAPWLQESAAQALISIGESAIPVLMDTCTHKSRRVRKRVRQVLRQIVMPPKGQASERHDRDLHGPQETTVQGDTLLDSGPAKTTDLEARAARAPVKEGYYQDDIVRGLRASLAAVLTTAYASGSGNYAFLEGVLSMAQNEASLYGVPWVDVISGLCDLGDPPLVAWLQEGMPGYQEQPANPTLFES